MTNEQIIQVVQAHSAGKKIRWRPWNIMPQEWQSCIGTPEWNFLRCEYSIEPQILFIPKDASGKFLDRIFEEKVQCELNCPHCLAIKFVEES